VKEMIGGEKRARNKTSGKVVIDGKKNERERKYSRHPPFSSPFDHFSYCELKSRNEED